MHGASRADQCASSNLERVSGMGRDGIKRGGMGQHTKFHSTGLGCVVLCCVVLCWTGSDWIGFGFTIRVSARVSTTSCSRRFETSETLANTSESSRLPAKSMQESMQELGSWAGNKVTPPPTRLNTKDCLYHCLLASTGPLPTG